MKYVPSLLGLVEVIVVICTGKASSDACSSDCVPSLHMDYTASDILTPKGKKARFIRLKKRDSQKEEVARDAEQKAEAAYILLNLSMWVNRCKHGIRALWRRQLPW